MEDVHLTGFGYLKFIVFKMVNHQIERELARKIWFVPDVFERGLKVYGDVDFPIDDHSIAGQKFDLDDSRISPVGCIGEATDLGLKGEGGASSEYGCNKNLFHGNKMVEMFKK